MEHQVMSENNINLNWQCSCGQINNGNFCCACGRQKVQYAAPPVQPQMQYQQTQYQQPQPSVAVNPKSGSKIKFLDYLVSLIATIGVLLTNIPGMLMSTLASAAGPFAMTFGGADAEEYTPAFLVFGLESIVFILIILAFLFNIISYVKSKKRPFKKYKPFRILVAIFVMISALSSIVSAVWLNSLDEAPVLILIPVIAVPLGIAALVINIIDVCSNKDQINA